MNDSAAPQDPGTPDSETAAESQSQRAHVRVRAWHILLLVAALVTTLLLARWQWTRYTSGTGSLQNLGYALQWPMFGLFFIFIYRAGMRMENEKIDAENSGDRMQALYDADSAAFGPPHTVGTEDPPAAELVEDFLPQRPEMDIEEFNALNTPQRRRPRTND